MQVEISFVNHQKCQMFAKTTSTINTVNATNRFLTSEKTDPKESGGWKDNLMSKFKTTVHCRNSPNFEEQIGRYIKGDVSISPGNLSWLVVGCMKYREVEVLKELLMHENMNALTISGSHESGGWETLIAGIPDTFAGTVLKLLAVPLNSGTGKLLFDVLSRMSKLDALFLNKVAVDNSVSELDGEALKRIKTLDVVADDYSDNDVLPLLFKIVENCELRNLQFDANTRDFVKDPASLEAALNTQTKLNSLCLKNFTSANHFDNFMSLLRCNRWLLELKLINVDIATSSCKLAEILTTSSLQAFSMRKCGLGHLSDAENTVNSLLAAVAAPSLQSLDFSYNSLSDDTTALLLATLKMKNTQLVFLNLGANIIGPKSVEALASLLENNKTLQSVSFHSLKPFDCKMEPLAEALKGNTVLERLDVNFGSEKELESLEDRFRKKTVLRGMRVILHSVDRKFPNELAMRIYEHGLTRRDALNVSSVNKEARGWQQGVSRV